MSLVKKTLRFASGTFISRISGVARESVVGAVFGASALMDAFIVAYRIPNLLRDLLAEGALGSSFTKVFTEVSHHDAEKARKFLLESLYLVAAITGVISLFGILFSPQIVLLVTEFEKQSGGMEKFSVTVGLTQLLFPYIALASVGAVVMGALYQRSGFFLSSVSPIAFNIANVIGALFLGKIAQAVLPENVIKYFGDASILGLALGVLLGGVLQFGMQFYGLWKVYFEKRSWRVKIFPISKEFKKVLTLMAPMVVASSAAQFNVMINTNFATQLETGAVSWLNYAFRILQLPVGMFGVAIGAVALPELVRTIAAAGKKVESKSSKQLFDAVSLVLWLTVPCFILMHQAAQPMIDLLYTAGRFHAADAEQTALALEAYSFGVLGYGLIKVMSSFFYAIDKTIYAMIVSIACVAINYIGNATLVRQYGHVGLAMTASVTLTLNALLLIIGSFVFGVRVELKKASKLICLLVFASLLATAYCYGVSTLQLDPFPETNLLHVKTNAVLKLGVYAVGVVAIFAATTRLWFKKLKY